MQGSSIRYSHLWLNSLLHFVAKRCQPFSGAALLTAIDRTIHRSPLKLSCMLILAADYSNFYTHNKNWWTIYSPYFCSIARTRRATPFFPAVRTFSFQNNMSSNFARTANFCSGWLGFSAIPHANLWWNIAFLPANASLRFARKCSVNYPSIC